MRIIITFDPEDGTDAVTTTQSIPLKYGGNVPDMVWFYLIKGMREILFSWRWRTAGAHPTDSALQAARDAAAEWCAPMDRMLTGVQKHE